MKLVIISDTHEQQELIQVPDGDVLIHCGDWTNRGYSFAMEKFLDWFAAQPHQHKMFIAGNHEISLDGRNKKAALEMLCEYTDKDSNLHYLENSSVILDGIKFYGSPATPFFCNWAFNFQRGKDIAIEWAKIPDDVNVLITHGTSYGILDMVVDDYSNQGRDLHQGCEELAKRIANLKQLKLHCGGHLHTDGGKTVNINGVHYVNASICTEAYKPTNKPVVIEI